MDISYFIKTVNQIKYFKKQEGLNALFDTKIHFKRIFVSSSFELPHPASQGFYRTRIFVTRDTLKYQWMDEEYWPSKDQLQLLVFDSKAGNWIHDGPWRLQFEELVQFLKKEIEEKTLKKVLQIKKLQEHEERKVQALRESFNN